MVLHSVAFSVNEDGLCMVQEAIQDGGSEGAVVIEDLRPVFERTVRSDNDGTLLVAQTDDLEEEIGAVLIDGQVT
jgi:hypothetical protein